MVIVFFAVVYLSVAGIVIFAGRVICEKYELVDFWDGGYYVLIGIFWPVTLIPFVGYLASSYYLERRTHSDGSK